ncbi:MAG: aldo/keto reductase, partial [Okeania sp. SIO2H7]|nr:aldo/keto reductase [Okeania sp. SIO2H7]
SGVNLFDTADAYMRGVSETMLGKALGERRQEAIVATKVGFRTGDALTDTGLSYRHIMKSAEASLKRLGSDYIEIYQIHITDPVTPPEETVRALDDLVRRGMVRYIGFSNLPAWKAARMVGIQECNNYTRFTAAQMYYSLVGRDLEHEVVPFVEDAGIGVLVWSPLAGGFLSGKYTRETPVPEDSRRKQFQFPPVDVEEGYKVVDVLKEIAANHGASPARVAIAWILSKPFISSVIIGANKMSHLEDNLGAVDANLSPEELERLDTMTMPKPLYPGWMQSMGWDPKLKVALS